jgi:nitrogen fixation/metabolism regulation signal transduction histidine kinase
MQYKHFYIAILIRLIIIVLFAVLGSYLFFEKELFIPVFIVFVFIVFAVVNLIFYLNKINRWISFFLLGIKNEDTTLRIPKSTGNKVIDGIFAGMYQLNEIFRQIKIDITTQEQQFRMVINQSSTGLFSVNEKGRIVNINPAASKLTGLNEFNHINSLSGINKTLPKFLLSSENSNKESSVIFDNKQGQKLLFKTSALETKKEKIVLVAVSDITKELDNREVDAWIKLARTLSHEIMNNITPITTLSQVISGYYKKESQPIDLTEIDKDTIENTVKGLKIIEERGVALMNFVGNYRKFTKLPEPQFNKINLSELIENSLIAIGSNKNFRRIEFRKNIQENILFKTDENLLSQVIINLLKNSCEAALETAKFPTIKIELQQTANSISINIANNGSKIPAEIREQIFVPFYTTKESGSGVGLSLSKQIMLKMGGDILLSSSNSEITTFAILLN